MEIKIENQNIEYNKENMNCPYCNADNINDEHITFCQINFINRSVHENFVRIINNIIANNNLFNINNLPSADEPLVSTPLNNQSIVVPIINEAQPITVPVVDEEDTHNEDNNNFINTYLFPFDNIIPNSNYPTLINNIEDNEDNNEDDDDDIEEEIPTSLTRFLDSMRNIINQNNPFVITYHPLDYNMTYNGNSITFHSNNNTNQDIVLDIPITQHNEVTNFLNVYYTFIHPNTIDELDDNIIESLISPCIPSQTECNICFELYNETNVIPVILNCKHEFCKSCIFTWLKKHFNCPLCKKQFI